MWNHLIIYSEILILSLTVSIYFSMGVNLNILVFFKSCLETINKGQQFIHKHCDDITFYIHEVYYARMLL